VGTRNKAKIGKHKIIPYGESFPYCESLTIVRMENESAQKSVIVVFILLKSLLLPVQTALSLLV